jgi:putative transposase
MFRQEENKNLCEKILREIADRHNISITELSVMPDHIHAVVGIPATMSISQVFHLLKGASSRELFKHKPSFRRRYSKGHFWSPGKFYRTVGDADAETVINYVREHQFRQTTLNGFSSTTNPAK